MTTIGHALTYFESSARRYRHTFRGSMFASFLNPVLFLSAMGLGLGQLVDQQAGEAVIDTFAYVTYIAPGLMATTAMQAGASDSSWPVVAGVKWLKTYDGVLATPMTVGGLVVGHVGFVTARVLFVSLVYGLVAVAFGALDPGPALLAVLPAGLTGLAFAAAVMAFSARLSMDIGLVNLFRFGITPMFLFSGAFFPITQLPDAIQPIAIATPLWHGVELTRAAALGTETSWNPALHVAVLLTFTVVGLLLATRKLESRMIS
jgi:lipooligosaccharide transport system permease protein